MKPSKSIGYNKISPKLGKTGIFADDLKIGILSPIYKSGNKIECDIYRPISVLPVTAKVFEKAVYLHSWVVKFTTFGTTWLISHLKNQKQISWKKALAILDQYVRTICPENTKLSRSFGQRLGLCLGSTKKAINININ